MPNQPTVDSSICYQMPELHIYPSARTLTTHGCIQTEMHSLRTVLAPGVRLNFNRRNNTWSMGPRTTQRTPCYYPPTTSGINSRDTRRHASHHHGMLKHQVVDVPASDPVGCTAYRLRQRSLPLDIPSSSDYTRAFINEIAYRELDRSR